MKVLSAKDRTKPSGLESFREWERKWSLHAVERKLPLSSISALAAEEFIQKGDEVGLRYEALMKKAQRSGIMLTMDVLLAELGKLFKLAKVSSTQLYKEFHLLKRGGSFGVFSQKFLHIIQRFEDEGVPVPDFLSIKAKIVSVLDPKLLDVAQAFLETYSEEKSYTMDELSVMFIELEERILRKTAYLENSDRASQQDNSKKKWGESAKSKSNSKSSSKSSSKTSQQKTDSSSTHSKGKAKNEKGEKKKSSESSEREPHSCGKFHPGGDAQCWDLHPELKNSKKGGEDKEKDKDKKKDKKGSGSTSNATSLSNEELLRNLLEYVGRENDFSTSASRLVSVSTSVSPSVSRSDAEYARFLIQFATKSKPDQNYFTSSMNVAVPYSAEGVDRDDSPATESFGPQIRNCGIAKAVHEEA